MSNEKKLSFQKSDIGSLIFLMVLKTFSLILAGIFFFRYMSGRESLLQVISLESTLFSNKFFAFISIIDVWTMYAVVLLLALYPFFKFSLLDKLVKDGYINFSED